MLVASIDCETIPNQNLPESVIPQFDPTTVKLGNVKDPDKRESKIAAERAKFNHTLDKTMSLSPDLCQVVCFCGAVYDTETGEDSERIRVSKEPATIWDGWKFIYNAYHNAIPIVSFNGNGFDLPVMLHRAMDLKVPMSRRIYNDITRRYSTKSHFDLMQVLADWDRQRWQPLDFYLKRYGVGEKTGDGSQVYGMWKDGKHKEIEEYCISDVLNTAKLFARLEGWLVEGVGIADA